MQKAPSLRRPTAILADDHEIVRSGLRSALEAPGADGRDGFEIVAEVANGVEAIAALRKHRPDVLFLDVAMPMAGGAEVLIEARRWSADTKVVVFTGISSIGKLSELIQIGVDGLFPKAGSNVEMLSKLPLILSGQRHIADCFHAELERAPKASPLTDRERQVLNLVISGASNPEIAERLGLSPKTVDRHRTSMMRKLDVHSAAQLIAYALREKLIDPAADL